MPDRCRQRQTGHRAVVGGGAAVGHRAVRPGHPVAGPAGRGDPDRGIDGGAQRLPGHGRHGVGVRVLATAVGGLTVRPHGLSRAVDGGAGLGPGDGRALGHGHALDGVLRGLAALGRGQVAVGEAEEFHGPGLAAAAGHPDAHGVVSRVQHVLAVAGRGHVGVLHSVGAVARPQAVARVPGVGGQLTDLAGGRGRPAGGQRGVLDLSDGRQMGRPGLGGGGQPGVGHQGRHGLRRRVAGGPLGVPTGQQVLGVQRLDGAEAERGDGGSRRCRGQGSHRRHEGRGRQRQADEGSRDHGPDATGAGTGGTGHAPHRSRVVQQGGTRPRSARRLDPVSAGPRGVPPDLLPMPGRGSIAPFTDVYRPFGAKTVARSADQGVVPGVEPPARVQRPVVPTGSAAGRGPARRDAHGAPGTGIGVGGRTRGAGVQPGAPVDGPAATASRRPFSESAGQPINRSSAGLGPGRHLHRDAGPVGAGPRSTGVGWQWGG